MLYPAAITAPTTTTSQENASLTAAQTASFVQSQPKPITVTQEIYQMAENLYNAYKDHSNITMQSLLQRPVEEIRDQHAQLLTKMALIEKEKKNHEQILENKLKELQQQHDILIKRISDQTAIIQNHQITANKQRETIADQQQQIANYQLRSSQYAKEIAEYKSLCAKCKCKDEETNKYLSSYSINNNINQSASNSFVLHSFPALNIELKMHADDLTLIQQVPDTTQEINGVILWTYYNVADALDLTKSLFNMDPQSATGNAWIKKGISIFSKNNANKSGAVVAFNDERSNEVVVNPQRDWRTTDDPTLGEAIAHGKGWVGVDTNVGILTFVRTNIDHTAKITARYSQGSYGDEGGYIIFATATTATAKSGCKTCMLNSKCTAGTVVIFSSCDFGLEIANTQPSSNDYLNGTITTKIAAFYQNTKRLISGNQLIAVKQLITPQSINAEDNLFNILRVCFITAYIMQFYCNFV